MFGGYTFTIVDDRKRELSAVHRRADFDTSSWRRVAQCVVDQVA